MCSNAIGVFPKKKLEPDTNIDQIPEPLTKVEQDPQQVKLNESSGNKVTFSETVKRNVAEVSAYADAIDSETKGTRFSYVLFIYFGFQ
jgi:hypothetical protein